MGKKERCSGRTYRQLKELIDKAMLTNSDVVYVVHSRHVVPYMQKLISKMGFDNIEKLTSDSVLFKEGIKLKFITDGDNLKGLGYRCADHYVWEMLIGDLEATYGKCPIELLGGYGSDDK